MGARPVPSPRWKWKFTTTKKEFVWRPRSRRHWVPGGPQNWGLRDGNSLCETQSSPYPLPTDGW